MKLGYDSASPISNPPTTTVVLFYCGGDTPHVWTIEEINSQPARYRLPIFVRSNPTITQAPIDAHTFLKYLTYIKCPKHSSTVLDLETAKTRTYVTTFGAILHSAGYYVLPYGGGDNLFTNPQLDGYFLAKPNSPAIPPTCVAVQFIYDTTYDLDWIDTSVQLWDTNPTNPTNPTTVKDETMPFYTTDSKGTGYVISSDLSHKIGIPDSTDAASLLASKQLTEIKLTDALIDSINHA